MVNTCQILIKRGRNNGKKCCEVHKYCRHKEEFTCPHCGQVTYYKWRFKTHVDSCKSNLQQKVLPQKPVLQQHLAISQPATSLQQTTKPTNLQPATKPDMAVMQQQNSPTPNNTFIQNQTVINNIDNSIHIHVGTTELFDELARRIGKREAVYFLLNAAVTQKTGDVVKQFLVGEKEPPYPVAIKDNKIRYINDNRQLVQENVDNFVDTIKDKARDAMIYATNEIIKTSLDNGETDDLYEVYEIGTIQENLANLTSIDNKQLVIELRELIEQPDHPFFAAGVSVVNIEPSKTKSIQHEPYYWERGFLNN